MTFGDNGGYWNENVVWEVEEVSGNGGGGKARLKAKKYKIFTELHRFSSPHRRKNKTFRTKKKVTAAAYLLSHGSWETKKL